MNMLKAAVIAGIVSFAALSANAATVSQAGTLAGGVFTIEGGGTTVAVSDPSNAWILSGTTPASEWIWDESKVVLNGTFGGPVTFLYTFSLSAFDAATASLSGLIGLDDIGTVSLNGFEIFSDLVAYDDGPNWGKFQTYGTTNAALFNAGENVLSFFVVNSGNGPAGLRATVTVEASAVPLPAALPLLGGALAAFGFVGLRRKRQTKTA